MLSTKDATLVYETLLMLPGMNDQVKIPLAVKRKTLLMLAKIIEQETSKAETRDGVLSVMDKEMTDELKSIAGNLLDKGELTELNERLGSLKLQ